VKDGDLIVLQRTGAVAAHPANGTASRRVLTHGIDLKHINACWAAISCACAWSWGRSS